MKIKDWRDMPVTSEEEFVAALEAMVAEFDEGGLESCGSYDFDSGYGAAFYSASEYLASLIRRRKDSTAGVKE